MRVHGAHPPGLVSVYPRQQPNSELREPDMSRPAATQDQRRVDYCLRLLTQICRRINLRIDMYQRARAGADADDRAQPGYGLRHLAGIEADDRKILEGLIDRVLRPAFQAALAEVPPISRRVRVRVRQDHNKGPGVVPGNHPCV